MGISPANPRGHAQRPSLAVWVRPAMTLHPTFPRWMAPPSTICNKIAQLTGSTKPHHVPGDHLQLLASACRTSLLDELALLLSCSCAILHQALTSPARISHASSPVSSPAAS